MLFAPRRTHTHTNTLTDWYRYRFSFCYFCCCVVVVVCVRVPQIQCGRTNGVQNKRMLFPDSLDGPNEILLQNGLDVHKNDRYLSDRWECSCVWFVLVFQYRFRFDIAYYIDVHVTIALGYAQNCWALTALRINLFSNSHVSRGRFKTKTWTECCCCSIYIKIWFEYFLFLGVFNFFCCCNILPGFCTSRFVLGSFCIHNNRRGQFLDNKFFLVS